MKVVALRNLKFVKFWPNVPKKKTTTTAKTGPWGQFGVVCLHTVFSASSFLFGLRKFKGQLISNTLFLVILIFGICNV